MTSPHDTQRSERAGANESERARFIAALRSERPLSEIATSLGYADSAGLRYRMKALGIIRRREAGAIVVEG